MGSSGPREPDEATASECPPEYASHRALLHGATLDSPVRCTWLFMDRYADAMIARGPTLAADRATATGSMHMVELPDAAAARVFAFEEPGCQSTWRRWTRRRSRQSALTTEPEAL
jgi:hypothetical protein